MLPVGDLSPTSDFVGESSDDAAASSNSLLYACSLISFSITASSWLLLDIILGI